MNKTLLRDTINLLEKFESENTDYTSDLNGFKHWIADNISATENEPDWEGKENGRSPESAISTLLVHMNRYGKSYSKSAIFDSDFSSQEDFIYLITLKTFGFMSKIELIKKNLHDKPTGIQIINRLISQQWVDQRDSSLDRRSKIINITQLGLETLERQMDKIRTATQIVTGDLTHQEKMGLIRLLHKLDHFHKPIFLRNIQNEELLTTVINEYPSVKKSIK